jgi:hypothetical protein
MTLHAGEGAQVVGSKPGIKAATLKLAEFIQQRWARSWSAAPHREPHLPTRRRVWLNMMQWPLFQQQPRVTVV